MSETFGSYRIEHVTRTLVRVYSGSILVFSGTPGAAYAYCGGI